MNKLFSLLLLIVMVAVGACARIDNSQPITIRSVHQASNGLCQYRFQEHVDDIYMVDECNKFQIGDKVQFQKVQP